MKTKALPSLLVVLVILLVTSCELSDPDLNGDKPGVSDSADDTTVKGFLTYGPLNYAADKRIWVIINGTGGYFEKNLRTDSNGFYIAEFDPGTAFAGQEWEIWIWAEDPDGTMEIVYNDKISIGTTFTYNINIT